MYGHSYRLQHREVSCNITASFLLIGLPKKIYAECGSQLTTADKELKDAVKSY